MAKIRSLKAREILDSRGNPTIEAEVVLENGVTAVAAAPSGASTGTHEALELRDGDKKRFGGKGVLRAVANVNTRIAREIKNMDSGNLRAIDEMLIELDGTPNKQALGANATTAVSMACARAGAVAANLPLFQFLGGKDARVIPVPMLNVLNGGKHAGTELSAQEFMLFPVGAKTFAEGIRMGAEAYHILGKQVKEKFGVSAKNVGDEGGYAPNLKLTGEALDALCAAVDEAGYGGKIKIALDPAASSFYSEESARYTIDSNQLSAGELVDYWVDLTKTYPIVSIEDGLAEEEFDAFAELTAKIGSKVQIVGDDLFVTNVSRVQEGIKKKAATAMLLKINQIGTISEACDAAKLCFKNGWSVVVSHRSGETPDDTIADLSVALGCGQIKSGAPARGERVAKYNRLLKIEAELGRSAQYAGAEYRRVGRA